MMRRLCMVRNITDKPFYHFCACSASAATHETVSREGQKDCDNHMRAALKGVLLWAFLPALVYSMSHPIVADGTISVNGSISSIKLSVVRSL